MTHPVQVHSDVSDLTFPTLRQLLLNEAATNGLPILEQVGEHLMLGSEVGAFGVSATPDGVRLHVRAQDENGLFVLRDAVMAQLDLLLPGRTQSLRWSDTPAAGALPPNFQFATVISKEMLGQDFFRLHLKLDRHDSFTDAAIHFRFVLPAPENRAPDWPSLKENGSIVWPQGDKQLHRPVYTTRCLDRATGVMVADVFKHDGGRVTERVSALGIGDKLALIGPGGSGVLDREVVTLCGDETAYPAIARILDTLPKGARATVLLSNRSGAQDYPMPDGPDVQLRWIATPETPKFAAAAAAAYRQQGEGFLWFAAEASEVAEMRRIVKEEGWSKDDVYAASYWTKPKQ